MEATYEEMKAEALDRMKKLEIREDFCDAFEHFKERTEYVPMTMPDLMGTKITLIGYPPTPEMKKRIKEFETETGFLVYYGILWNINIGRMLTMLYVSKHKDEWDLEHEDLDALMPVAYVANLDHEECSEFGGVILRKVEDGLARIG